MKTRNYIMTLTAMAVFSAGVAPAFSEEKGTTDPATSIPVPAKENTGKEQSSAVIQLAILLDTSGSMDGLIDQARIHLWQIVNEMTLARKNGKLPKIQIALYEYGNDGLKSADNYIRQVMPFTDDLDGISEALFKLKTDGGSEYCGAVIRNAVRDLAWNKEDKEALKMIFIAGNEPFTQGPVKYSEAVREALEKGITVNTVLCGGWDGDQETWKDGSTMGDGSYVVIDHNKREMIPETPQDKELMALNKTLNSTYIAYGNRVARAKKLERQVAQDESNMVAAPQAFAERVKSKANNAVYENSSWDMVDAFSSGDSIAALEELDEKELLPDEFKGKSAEEIKKIVKEKGKERSEIQAKILDLSNKRDAWVADWRKKNAAGDGKKTLNDAVLETVRKQAKKRNFEFGNKEGEK